MTERVMRKLQLYPSSRAAFVSILAISSVFSRGMPWVRSAWGDAGGASDTPLVRYAGPNLVPTSGPAVAPAAGPVAPFLVPASVPLLIPSRLLFPANFQDFMDRVDLDTTLHEAWIQWNRGYFTHPSSLDVPSSIVVDPPLRQSLGAMSPKNISLNFFLPAGATQADGASLMRFLQKADLDWMKKHSTPQAQSPDPLPNPSLPKGLVNPESVDVDTGLETFGSMRTLPEFGDAATSTDQRQRLSDYVTDSMAQWKASLQTVDPAVLSPQIAPTAPRDPAQRSQSLLEREYQALKDAVDEVLNQNAILDGVDPSTPDCDPSAASARLAPQSSAQSQGGGSRASQVGFSPISDVTQSYPPVMDRDPFAALPYTSSLTNQGPYQVNEMDFMDPSSLPSVVQSFGFTAYPGGMPNPSGLQRDWQFFTYGGTRQDEHLMIHDGGSTDWHSPSTSVYFFPRKVTPSIRAHTDGSMSVTLPTGEVVLFDAQGKLKSSLLSESALSQSNSNNRPAPHLTYSGTGVTLSISARGSPQPEDSGANAGIRDPYAVITKPGKAPCKVSPNLVFSSVPVQGGGEQPQGSTGQFRFQDDASFDAFLQSHCGFSMS